MKTKLLVLTATLIGAASLSANAGVYFSFRLPFPPMPVVVVHPPVPVVVAAPVVCAPPVVDAAPAAIVVAPAPVAVVAAPCPGPGYVYVSGYWSGHVYVNGYWHAGPHAVVHAHHGYGWRH